MALKNGGGSCNSFFTQYKLWSQNQPQENVQQHVFGQPEICSTDTQRTNKGEDYGLFIICLSTYVGRQRVGGP